MTPEETVAAVAPPIQKIGGAFMQQRKNATIAAELGMHPWALYYCGRGGVLGDVDADVVTAAFVFMPAAMVRKAWDRGRSVRPVQEMARRYAEICQEWGRTRFAGFEGAGRLAELAERVVEAVDPAGLPLFAGWRAMPLPEDAPARACQAVHLLREHRGGVHAVAVLASGLSPLEASVSITDGPGSPGFFGWPEPHPDPAPLAERRAAAEARTDELVAPAYAVLSADERTELAELLAAASAVAFAPRS
ncbi:MAG: hypothetical protein NVSMB13_13690 [Mycobacteriales bacterium]